MKKLLSVLFLLSLIFASFAQDNAKYIEVEGTATETITPSNIEAELNFYSLAYDFEFEEEVSESDKKAFNKQVNEMIEKLNVKKYYKDAEGLQDSYYDLENYVTLQFSSYEDYKTIHDKIYEDDYYYYNEDVTVDLYINETDCKRGRYRKSRKKASR